MSSLGSVMALSLTVQAHTSSTIFRAGDRLSAQECWRPRCRERAQLGFGRSGKTHRRCIWTRWRGARDQIGERSCGCRGRVGTRLCRTRQCGLGNSPETHSLVLLGLFYFRPGIERHQRCDDSSYSPVRHLWLSRSPQHADTKGHESGTAGAEGTYPAEGRCLGGRRGLE